MMEGDPLSNVLYVDLSRRISWVEDRKDLFEDHIGGAGAAIQLLQQECPRHADPLSPENPVIFAVGPLVGVFPTASKTVAMFKSPHTRNLGESYAGGRSAVAIRMAGYGAIVLRGSSETPVYVAVHGGRVHFRDASVLWGMGNSYTVGRVIREREPRSGFRTIMRIGRAGENRVSYASLVTETYRHFGRLGLGAVFGSKKLKALVVSGSRSMKFKNPKMYREVYSEIFDALTKSSLARKYHELGTSMNVNPLNEIKALPTMNLKKAWFESADDISGESFAEEHLGRRLSCAHCPISCVHLAALRERYESEPYFYKTRMISYDYELIYALGSMIGVSRPEGVLRLIDQVEMEGLDAISTGVALAWATEMQERGLVSEEQTGGLRLTWGDYDAYVKAIRLIASQAGEFYRSLARGVEYASSVYGGDDFALSFGGNEMAGYHTGPAAYVDYLTGPRHSHLDGGGYSLDQKALASGEKPSPERIASALVEEERWRQILSSLIVCYFARKIYTPDIVSRALKVVGYELDVEELKRIGSEILKAKMEFKIREGFDPTKIRIPARALETPTALGLVEEDLVEQSVDAYWEKAGVRP